MRVFILSLFFVGGLLNSCAIHHPCADGGDISWNPKIIGDKRCTQKTDPDGITRNHGKFTQYYSSTGTIALDGNFDEGRKSGIWLFYGEDGHLMSAKYFEKGVEKTAPVEIQKKIDLIIQQKAGMK